MSDATASWKCANPRYCSYTLNLWVAKQKSMNDAPVSVMYTCMNAKCHRLTWRYPFPASNGLRGTIRFIDGMNPSPYCSSFQSQSMMLEAMKKFTDPMR